MNPLSILESFGESAFDIIAERLTLNGVNVRSAYLRPNRLPYSSKTDVTQGFLAVLSKNMILTDYKTTPQQLYLDSAKKPGFWRGITKTKATSSPAISIAGSWWLCVEFSIPGGKTYISCYLIPEESITFPPILPGSVGRIMPLCRQIACASVVTRCTSSSVIEHPNEKPAPQSSAPPASSSPSSVTILAPTPTKQPIKCATPISSPSSCLSSDDGSDGLETEMTILDITKQLSAMLGPDGDAFGRGNVNIEIAIADTLDSKTGNSENLLLEIVSCAVRGQFVGVSVMTGDGITHPATGKFWECPLLPSTTKKIHQ